MKNLRSFAALFATGVIAMTASAQSGTPLMEPPPISSETPTATPASRPSDRLNPTETGVSAGKSTDATATKELRFAAVDANNDGGISLSEFTTFMDAGAEPRSAGEATAASPSEALFHRIDRDGDNSLSEKEVTAYQDERDRNSSKW